MQTTIYSPACFSQGETETNTGIEPTIDGTEMQERQQEAEQITEVLAFAGYGDFEAAADRTAVKIKEGFMEMGYILKIARDTDILRGSEYANHEEFAARRYDLDKGTVSRYIRIVERFSVDGNSHILKDSYRQMGFAKLSLMLHMPDEIAEELMDSLSKMDVLAVKEELDAENAVSDIELAIERAEIQETGTDQEETLLQKAVRQLGKEQQDIYRNLWQAVQAEETDRIGDILAPQSDAIHMARIPGTGRVMIAISDTHVSVTMVRTKEKEHYHMQDMIEAVRRICRPGAGSAKLSYWEVYGEEMEYGSDSKAEGKGSENGKVAPVQQKEGRKKSKVTKANTGKDSASANNSLEAAQESQEEPQLPGQMTVEDYPELLPESNEAAGAGEESDTAAAGVKEMEETAGSSYREENNGESDECGNLTGVSDGAGDLGDDVESGSDQMGEDTVSEHYEGAGASAGGGREADTGVSGTGDALAEISKESTAAGVEMTDEAWKNLWNEFDVNAQFIADISDSYAYDELINCEIPKGTLEEGYKAAVDVAAALERMINGKKYFTE